MANQTDHSRRDMRALMSLTDITFAVDAARITSVHDHCGLLRVNHLNLHDSPPRIRNSDVILPMTTVASAEAYLLSIPVKPGPNAGHHPPRTDAGTSKFAMRGTVISRSGVCRC